MKNSFLIFISFLIISTSLSAQDFLDGAFTFSSKKESFITLTDGKEITGFIDDIDRKKGLIEEITIIDMNKKKIKLKPLNRLLIPVVSSLYIFTNFEK